jgi:ribonuclease P protein component
MLSSAHRMRSADEFAQAIRAGSRAGSARLVGHLCVTSAVDRPSRIGFVVSKAVGGAVVRTQVKRRLRAAMAAQLFRVPEGGLLVVRALPGAGGASFAELQRSLDSVLARLANRRPR